MIDRTADCFGVRPGLLAGDSAYGAAEMLNWLPWSLKRGAKGGQATCGRVLQKH